MNEFDDSRIVKAALAVGVLNALVAGNAVRLREDDTAAGAAHNQLIFEKVARLSGKLFTEVFPAEPAVRVKVETAKKDEVIIGRDDS
jgi:hypothetical protein